MTRATLPSPRAATALRNAAQAIEDATAPQTVHGNPSPALQWAALIAAARQLETSAADIRAAHAGRVQRHVTPVGGVALSD